MDIFYNTRDLSLTQKIALLEDCKKICFRWWTDKLDYSESFSRQKIDMTFEEIMVKFDDSTHFSVIDRACSPKDKKKHFEIGFCTMVGLDYYLWILVEDEIMPTIIEKYNLKPINA
jgi:hypothetical protein